MATIPPADVPLYMMWANRVTKSPAPRFNRTGPYCTPLSSPTSPPIVVDGPKSLPVRQQTVDDSSRDLWACDSSFVCDNEGWRDTRPAAAAPAAAPPTLQQVQQPQQQPEAAAQPVDPPTALKQPLRLSVRPMPHTFGGVGLQPVQQPQQAPPPVVPPLPAQQPQQQQAPTHAVPPLPAQQPMQQPQQQQAPPTAPPPFLQPLQQLQQPAPPPSPPPPDPQQHSTLASKFAPGWHQLQQPLQQQPMQLLQMVQQPQAPPTSPIPTTATAPKASKNLLALNVGMKPLKMSEVEVKVKEESRKAKEEEEEKREKRELKGRSPEEENEHRYERYSRRLALERGCTDGLLETEERMRIRDASMPARGQLDRATAVSKWAAAAASTCAHTHDGRWWTASERDPEKKSKWFHTVEDPEEDVNELDPIPDGSDSLALYSPADSLRSEEKEALEMLGLPLENEKLVWQRGFVIRKFRRSKEESYEYEIFTLQRRFYIKSTGSEGDEELGMKRIKFTILSNGEAIVRKSSYTSYLFSLNVRIGKTIKLKGTALVAYRHPSSRDNWIMWSDDVGLIVVTEKDVEKYGRQSLSPTNEMMVPLRVVEIAMQAEHSDDRNRRIDPRSWLIQLISITQMTEEVNDGDDVLVETAWPRLAQRVDDLEWKEMGRDGVIHLRTKSFPERIIVCKKDQWMRSPIDERSKSYRRQKFTAVMVPYEQYLGAARKDHWQCLLLAPLPLVSYDTEDRIFNFRPLNILVDVRGASLPEGWSKGGPAPYPIILADVDSK